MWFAYFRFFLLVAVVLTSTVEAQVDRNELGKRVRRFEVAWESADESHRGKSVEPMQQAVQSFFGLNLRRAAASLDKAYFAVRGDQEPSLEEGFALSRRLKISPSLVEKGGQLLKVELEPFYEAKENLVENARIRLTILDGSRSKRLSHEVSGPEATSGFELSLQSLEAGDHQIVAEWIGQNLQFEFARSTLSVVDHLTERLEAIEQKYKLVDEDAKRRLDDTSRATVKELLQILKSQKVSRTLESDYPSNQFLETCEAILAAGEETRSSELLASVLRESAFKKDTWITLAIGSKQIATRVRGPQNPKGPLPVLFAFHGAGGSENMFFETYGAGRLVQLATERGWLVVAPRQGLFGMGLDCEKMLDVLSQFFEVDRSRVFLVGHSMGAAQVMKQVTDHPGVVCAAVAIGGGGKIGRVDPSIPWYVTAGEFDFGKSGASSLAKSLKELKCEVSYREVPRVEHMVIVQAALDEVFAFLDKCPKKMIGP